MLIYHTFKKISAWSKVFVECILCFGELGDVSSFSSFFLIGVTHSLGIS